MLKLNKMIYALTCLGFIVIVIFFAAVMIVMKVKEYSREEFKRNLTKHETRTGALLNDRKNGRKRKS